jgi:hypothetical protein
VLDNGATSAFRDFDVARQLDGLEWRGVKTHYLRRPQNVGLFALRRWLYEDSNSEAVCHLDDDVSLPPDFLVRLWSGLFEDGFALARGLVMAADRLHLERWNKRGPRMLDEMYREVTSGRRQTHASGWIEVSDSDGTNLMYRRSDFDATGAYETAQPYFDRYPYESGEDVALCLALKARGPAYIDVSDMAFHFSPETRYFAPSYLGPAGELRSLLKDKFGVDHISMLHNPACDGGESRHEVLLAIDTLRGRLRPQRRRSDAVLE